MGLTTVQCPKCGVFVMPGSIHGCKVHTSSVTWKLAAILALRYLFNAFLLAGTAYLTVWKHASGWLWLLVLVCWSGFSLSEKGQR